MAGSGYLLARIAVEMFMAQRPLFFFSGFISDI